MTDDRSIEFIGYITPQDTSETRAPRGPVVDAAHVAAVANAHESSGFDRALIAFHATQPDSLVIAGQAEAVTRRLGLMIAHRTGFTAPTVAARQLATLDQFSGGRVAVHIITGGDEIDLARDGESLRKDKRYERTREYLDIMRLEWTNDEPFDYAGQYYNVRGARSAVRPVNGSVPVYFGGASDAALKVAAQHADVYALWGETQSQVAEITARVRASAKAYDRHPRFSLSFRPILADREEDAWDRAEAIYQKSKVLLEAQGELDRPVASNTGSQRLRAVAAQGDRLDRRLWTKMASLTGGRWNSTSLVGTPLQVAEALLDYHDLGVTTFLIRGYDPLEDAIDYGRELIPLTRDLAKRRTGRSTAA